MKNIHIRNSKFANQILINYLMNRIKKIKNYIRSTLYRSNPSLFENSQIFGVWGTIFLINHLLLGRVILTLYSL